MSGVILGTAGHIDHGKTALVHALTGVDTDRLQEEKARGITIELGFAELPVDDEHRFGVVDVPGHEAFVRAMVAGAAGMDVVLLVVAADEGVMPQTREHLAIVELLDVPELVVALTKCDAVEQEWLELVDDEVSELLAGTRYAGAARIATSATAGTGLDALLEALVAAADRARGSAVEDLVRLPLDRAFTIQGTGTVVTGTLWSGTLRVTDRARLLPQDLEARIRSIQVHDREVEEARAGERTAVALSGEGADRDRVGRGSTLVTSPSWSATWMLTARARLLDDTDWTLSHNQRLHVHHGTAEVLARCALLGADDLGPGDVGWIQLRLEEPLVARARDRFVLRAYSPVTTIGGGVIAEADPPKRARLEPRTRAALEAVVSGQDTAAVAAFLELCSWRGASVESLPVHVGLAPGASETALRDLEKRGVVRAAQRVFGSEIRAEAESRVLGAVDAGHAADPLRPSVSLANVRSALPSWAPPELADATVSGLLEQGRLEAADGGVRDPAHRPELSEEQGAASARLEAILSEGGLSPPFVDELPEDLRSRDDLWSLLRRLESLGVVLPVADGLYVSRRELADAAARIAARLGGRTDLGPADFKEVLPVTRKRLIPLLNYFDGQGVTVRHDRGRDVPVGR